MKIFFCLLIVIPCLSFGSAQINWVDLPPDSLKDILYEYDTSFDKLNILTQNYHRIDKTSWNKIDLRIKNLHEIAKYANEIKLKIKNEYLFNTASKYASLATEKAKYLQKLKELKEYKYKKIEKDVFNSSMILARYFPLLLNNERKLEYKTQEFWGQYFIEAVDPCHRRQLTSYYEVWAKKCKQGELPDFFLWLEEQNVSIFLPSINVLSESELAQYQVVIKNGKFYSINGELITTEKDCINSNFSSKSKFINTVNFKKETIFIINANENMFLTYTDEKNAHVTLSNYLPLIGSGKIWLKEGMVKKLSFESGHYLPRMEHFIQVIQFFENRGVQLDDNINIVYYIVYKDYTSTLKEFKNKYMS